MWLAESLRSKRLIESRADWTRAELVGYQQRCFHDLLEFVWAHSPFYRETYAQHGIREHELAELSVEDLPILNKEIVMEGFDRLSNDPLLKRDRLEAWLHGDTRNPYEKRYMVVHTSGSSGTMGIFVYDKSAWARTRGIVMAHATLGRAVNPFRRFRFAMCVATHGHFGAVTAAQSLPRALFKVCTCSVLDPIQTTIDTLNRFQPEQLGGYPTTLHELAQASLDGKLVIQPTAVSPGGEPLSEEAAATIEKAWGVAPTPAYASSESMCLALRVPGREGLTLMEGEHIFEVLDEADQPVGPGETGRMIMTNLYNRAMPLIRYDMRDFVTRGTRPEGASLDSILRVEGRVNDALPVRLADGSLDSLHPIVLSEFFVPGATKFQFVSESPSQVRIRYLAAEERDDSVQAAFARLLQLKGAEASTTVSLERVGELPVDPLTGKYRLVVL